MRIRVYSIFDDDFGDSRVSLGLPGLLSFSEGRGGCGGLASQCFLMFKVADHG